MKRFIRYPSINQFRNVIKKIQHEARYEGYDEVTDKVIYNQNTYPTLEVIGTEKVHGTNAAVCYSNPDGFWVQSRKNIITPESDNAGCAFAAHQNQSEWMYIIHNLAMTHNIDLDENIISLYYEWCGGNIQKNSAVSSLDKMAVLFAHFKVSPLEPQGDDPEDEPSEWRTTFCETYDWIDDKEARIFNVMNFPTYKFSVDFNNPQMSQNKLVDVVEKVIEPNSPLGKQLGVEGNIGEGMVICFTYKDSLHMFKVKGDKHSKSKVKKLDKVDEVKLQKIQDIAERVTPAWRLEQMFDEANDTMNGGEPSMQNMGKFFKALNGDIIKEESDIIAEAGLEPKEIFSTTSRIARGWYMEQVNKDVFG